MAFIEAIALLLKATKSTKKKLPMNAKYFAALTAIVLATGLSLPATHAQASQVVLTSMFNDVLVQPSLKSPSLSKDTAPPPPPVDGRPDERTPAGTRSHNHQVPLRYSQLHAHAIYFTHGFALLQKQQLIVD
jgi:hypothetical protein